jgi:hypothetical protein
MWLVCRLLMSGSPDLWDSGASNRENTWIVYGGEALSACQRAWWTSRLERGGRGKRVI